MRRPRNSTRDFTDAHLRRCARALGYKGRTLPLSIADLVVHANKPGDFTLLQYDGETRRAAADRLRVWAWGVPK